MYMYIVERAVFNIYNMAEGLEGVVGATGRGKARPRPPTAASTPPTPSGLLQLLLASVSGFRNVPNHHSHSIYTVCKIYMIIKSTLNIIYMS